MTVMFVRHAIASEWVICEGGEKKIDTVNRVILVSGKCECEKVGMANVTNRCPHFQT